MRNLDQARLHYEATLAKRLERLHTRHSFKQAKNAADTLYANLVKNVFVRVASVGIGLNPERTDLTIEVAVEDQASVKHVPPVIDGIGVKVEVAGQVTAY